jgi:hypothetical protein
VKFLLLVKIQEVEVKGNKRRRRKGKIIRRD